ncbi:PLE, putative [Ricinus communis]|uniref:PLE, putative n=1 Tax=Ricinus communis TaxID=3988 RepID=B9RDD8_RICCO|nr:PLE, putative [Ricinus communis]|eukprot:XP_002511727.1 65-kDa microtubule-associated protein 4 [Ricinus communis]
MYNRNHDGHAASIKTTCRLLLLELQKIWDEVGENDVERDKMVFEIEQECAEVYKGKVNEANRCRSELQRQIALAEAEIETILSALGDDLHVKDEQKDDGRKNLHEKLQIVNPMLEEMRKRKSERKKQFVEVVHELNTISKEIFGPNPEIIVDDGTDLSLKRLVELQNQLHELQNDKSNRVKQVLGLMETLKSLSVVLGVDFKHIMHNIHPTFDDSDRSKDITDGTIERLTTALQSLHDVKIQRIKRLRGLGAVLLELWDLMGTPVEEQLMFQKVTSSIAASECEITEPNMLSIDLINQVEDEVFRLKQLKSSKVKELVLKKRLELEEICRNIHMVTEALGAPEFSVEVLASGAVDPMHLLEEIELEIERVKEEAFSRKEILDKVEKWLAAREEECWLEEYNRDDNRYNAGRGAHLTLKRAERARAVVNKIPAMVEALTSKTIVWEKERGTQFLYDGERLLSRLEEYNYLRKEKEQERIRQRDQKKRQVQLIVEQEALFGAKPSPSKSGKKPSRTSIGVARNQRLSLGGAMLQNLKAQNASCDYVDLNKIGDSVNQNSYLGRRTSEIAGHLVKKNSSAKVRQSESDLIRKPLSPIPLTLSYKANIANFVEDQKGMGNEKLQTADPCIKTPIRTPTRPISAGDAVTTTPKTLPIPVPTTPTTISTPMLMASTPATPCVSSAASTAEKVVEQIEYSFEEVRVGILYPEGAQTQTQKHCCKFDISAAEK